MHYDAFPFWGCREKQFNMLIELSSIRSNKMINALRGHVVYGESRKIVCKRYGVNPGYLSVCLARLVRVYHLVCMLNQFY
ncbi:adhesin biosynthesis transcription regulatory family protein [Escherichia coli]|uniref:adhesin biosynthesis transcription regulatory family protein n=1 Tax=Escherichia coli TaxID=562 RepID=UPI001C4039E9|nr:adhesin biosynthesis transcription regulatory family protein [Escherichia coli]